LGVYISPWDRNHPDYGTEKYNDVFVNMMKELFTNYGPIWELWWDGANGEGPNGKRQVYDWHRFERTVRELSPNTVVFSDIGPDVRWCGNEDGIAGKTNWNTLDTAGFTRGAGAPPQDTLNTGNVNGKNWIPAECDVSIRPGWFYHKAEDDKVKAPEQLFNLYLKSVGRGANLLLNVPPDGRGLITKYDSAALVGFRKLKDHSFNKNLASDGMGYFVSGGVKRYTNNFTEENRKTYEIDSFYFNQSMGVEFVKSKKINCIVLTENIEHGQHARAFRLFLMNSKTRFYQEISGTTIGNKRVITFPIVDIDNIGLIIGYQKWFTQISEIGAYLIDEKLIEQ